MNNYAYKSALDMRKDRVGFVFAALMIVAEADGAPKTIFVRGF